MFNEYASKFSDLLSQYDWQKVQHLSELFQSCWRYEQQVFICGNGGSAGNAIHLANDYSYGCAKKASKALRVQSLSANPAVLTCLANDEDFSEVYALQLHSYAMPGDLLLVLSGSGNSENILKAIAKAKQIGMKTAAILGFDGGKALPEVDIAIHSPIADMQISEDFQLVVGHMIMKWLSQNVPENLQLPSLETRSVACA